MGRLYMDRYHTVDMMCGWEVATNRQLGNDDRREISFWLGG